MASKEACLLPLPSRSMSMQESQAWNPDGIGIALSCSGRE